LTRYPHGTEVTWEFKGIPEQFCGPVQFISIVSGKMTIEDEDHPSNEAYKRTIESMRKGWKK
jgi:hypothetical protein